LLRDPIARHFSLKAMELLAGPPYHLAPGAETQVDDCALKLVFYVVFTLRSRAQLTMLSMRALSMLMMMFMMMVMGRVGRVVQIRAWALPQASRAGEAWPAATGPLQLLPCRLRS
tara:strand:+ start:845 stop:1189 length:345 start_codon:yes stop_codon:yes gene_type:complete